LDTSTFEEDILTLTLGYYAIFVCLLITYMRRKHQNDVKGAAKPHTKTMKGRKSNTKGNKEQMSASGLQLYRPAAAQTTSI
jgi:hypothetical protein